MVHISDISWNGHISFWKVVGKFVEKCGYVDINYFIWKIVILSFVIPFSFMYIKKIEK